MITVMITYHGKNGNAKKFVQEMISSKLVEKIRNEEGNLKYEYFFPLEDEESVLLVDSWKNQESLDRHHKLPLMTLISQLREKYDLHMEVCKYQPIVDNKDAEYIRQ